MLILHSILEVILGIAGRLLMSALDWSVPFLMLLGTGVFKSIRDKASEKVREQYAEKVKENIDALGRMQLNLEDIKEFYTWSQNQAKGAFYLAVVMFIAGFTLIVIAVYRTFKPDANVDAAMIPAIGGAITEFIAATTLVVYRSSLSQLNHYHQALHEDERFLSSVNLIDKFHDEKLQDEMLKELIQSEIQMNIDSVRQNKKEGKKATKDKIEKKSESNSSAEAEEETEEAVAV